MLNLTLIALKVNWTVTTALLDAIVVFSWNQGLRWCCIIACRNAKYQYNTHIYIYEGCSKFLHVEECVISSKLLQASDPLSHFILRQLHLNIYILLEDVGPCSPSSASSDTTSPQFRPSFRGKAIFRQALAKLSPNFREKSPNSFYKMKHT